MRRFLLHILPRGFVRIRHYGFLGNPAKAEAIPRCRELLGEPCPETPQKSSPPRGWQELLRDLTGEDPRRCPHCRKGRLIVTQELAPQEGPPP